MDFRAGDIQWLKNAAILHARTEFEDHAEPERKRHLLRLWLTSRRAFADGDPLLQRGVPPQQGATSDAAAARAAVEPVTAPRVTRATPRVSAEAIGTALLLAAIVGSGIMGERLAGGNVAIALLANSIATGAALVALILAFGPISGAHFNPLVTLCVADRGGLPWRDAPVVCRGADRRSRAGRRRRAPDVRRARGVAVDARAVGLATGVQRIRRDVRTGRRSSWAARSSRAEAVPFAVGAYITAAYWFTASTSFANPAVTLARAMTGTFAGIRPVDVPVFIAAQLLGALSAALLFRWLVPGRSGERA